jgi:hypothetical protein
MLRMADSIFHSGLPSFLEQAVSTGQTDAQKGETNDDGNEARDP